MTARSLTDADVEAIAEKVAEKLRSPPSRPKRRDRKPRVASPEAIAAMQEKLRRKGI